MTTTRKVMVLALPLTALLAACGGSAPDDAATPSASPAPATSSAMTDPAPPAFMVCRSCHSTQAGQNGIGPTLAGIVGSKAGEVPGYNFSPALKNSGIVWDRASLDTWLKGPMKMVPGTKMVIPVSDPAKRKAIIDYLETLK
ncbi:cytochrome c family protein [Novosphingobium sp. AP12]|uniref:c-type cytochrome n=1 Tax=Novosphingobium sp. AP12 TaxID=1144305 RepID=UPI000271E77D|nr:c-type cytochrome [Novosphingobium sp. AP12]EJL26984.1 cytochrome c2 [Novosphingobium sp. AP12]